MTTGHKAVASNEAAQSTPETDAALALATFIAPRELKQMMSGTGIEVVSVAFARKLERQRDALLGALKAVDGALDSLNWCAWEEDRNSVWVEWVYPAWDMARAAIAMVEKP